MNTVETEPNHDGNALAVFNRDMNAREAESIVVEDVGQVSHPSHPPLETSASKGVEPL